jgi:hypothetical protein
MSRRLVVLLGVVVFAAAVGVVGMARPAAADLLFGNCATNGQHITPSVTCDPANPANSFGFPPGVSSLTWSKDGSNNGDIVTEGFDRTPVGTPAPLLVEGSANLEQQGIGIVDATGLVDHEINNTNLLDIFPGRFVNATFSIDSLQPGENFFFCKESTAGVIGVPGGPGCSGDIVANGIPGPESWTSPSPVSFGDPSAPFLAIGGDVVGGVFGDVKVRDFDVVPEPGTMALLLTGLAGLIVARRRRSSI